MVAEAPQVKFDNGELLDKGLKGGALGLISSVVIGVASTAPAYSLAATLGFVACSPARRPVIVSILAFVPIFLVSFGYKELNRREPDCGTTFTWGTKAFGPKTGWIGGWGILAADVLVMASLAQVAGQYFFELFGAHGIGGNATSGWVLLVGIIWIVLMTWICYVGIEISANIQKVLLAIEVVMLAVFSITALVKTYGNNAPEGSSHVSLVVVQPCSHQLQHFVQGILLMLFIYWGWDSAVSVNEETKDKERTPGRAAVISTVLLVAIYTVVGHRRRRFAGVGRQGHRPGEPRQLQRRHQRFWAAPLRRARRRPVLLQAAYPMVLTSAAASTQTTILPTARTHACDGRLQVRSRRRSPRSTRASSRRAFRHLAMGGVSIALYLMFNFLAQGNIIPDSVTALGWMIAFYYGLTGFACAWYYRRDLRNSARDLWVKGIIPLLGGVLLFAFLVYDIWLDWNPAQSYTSWSMPFSPHWDIGGVFIIGVLSFVVGLVLMAICIPIYRPFFRGEVMSPSPELAELLKND